MHRAEQSGAAMSRLAVNTSRRLMAEDDEEAGHNKPILPSLTFYSVLYITLSPIILHNPYQRVPTMKSCIMYITLYNVSCISPSALVLQCRSTPGSNRDSQGVAVLFRISILGFIPPPHPSIAHSGEKHKHVSAAGEHFT